MKKLLTNLQIWDIYEKLEDNFREENLSFPAKISYYILINKQELYNKYRIIEQMRQNIGKKYGVYDSEINAYHIPKEKREIAQTELDQLLEVSQSVEINFCSLKDLEDLNISMRQMETLLFMIEKEE